MAITFSIQRYRVSLWFRPRVEGAPNYVRKEVLSASDEEALRDVLRTCNIRSAYLAKVFDIRTTSCCWFSIEY